MLRQPEVRKAGHKRTIRRVRVEFYVDDSEYQQLRKVFRKRSAKWHDDIIEMDLFYSTSTMRGTPWPKERAIEQEPPDFTRGHLKIRMWSGPSRYLGIPTKPKISFHKVTTSLQPGEPTPNLRVTETFIPELEVVKDG